MKSPHCVRWGPSSPSPKGHSPQFSADICCGQMAGRIKMPLGMEVGISRGDFVLDMTQPPPQKWEGGAHFPIFGPFLVWMDQDGNWHGGGPWSRPHCAWWGPSSPFQKRGRAPPPIFGPFLQRAQCSHCKRCISYSNSVCPSVGRSVCLAVTRQYCVKTTARSTVQFALLDSKMCLVL